MIVNGIAYQNTNLVQQAPYTPTRSSWEYTSWQANDPLVHYLASDLNCITRDSGISRADYLPNSHFPNPDLNTTGVHYQPWGRNAQMVQIGGVNTDAYSLAIRDPLVWYPDSWSFPVNQGWNLNWLGRIHRGTPWQTLYLKSTNIDTNTWSAWSGVSSSDDTTLTAPVADWHLIGLLQAILNTNDLLTQFSASNPNPAAWSALMQGFDVMTNTTWMPASYVTPAYDTALVSSNSTQAASLAMAICSAQTEGIHEIGALLSIPELTEHSPWLNWNNSAQTQYAISDDAYEASQTNCCHCCARNHSEL